MQPFGDWLRARMAERRPPVQASQVARAVGTSDSTISGYLNNPTRHPGTENCAKFADYFHVPVEEVLRAAGHLPPLAEPTEEPELSREARELAFEYDALGPDDREVVAHIVQRLRSAQPPAGPADPA